jgi:hypothetical protein
MSRQPTLLLLLVSFSFQGLNGQQPIQNFCTNSTALFLSGAAGAWDMTRQVSTGASSYSNNANCALLVTAPSGFVIGARFSSFATEANADYLRIFDGTSGSALSLTAATGSLPQRDVVSSRPSMYLTFTSNNAYTAAGAVIRFMLLPQSQISALGSAVTLAAGEVQCLTTNVGAGYTNSAAVTVTFTAPL